jgi:hypothetical protein
MPKRKIKIEWYEVAAVLLGIALMTFGVRTLVYG